MARSDDQGVKSLAPPVIPAVDLLPQRQHPLPVLLDGPLDRRVQLEQSLVAVRLEDPLDPVPDGRVVPKRGSGPILLQAPLRQRPRERVGGEGHDLRRDVAVQILVDGSVGEAELVAVDLLGDCRHGWELRGNGDGLVCRPCQDPAERRDGRREVRRGHDSDGGVVFFWQ